MSGLLQPHRALDPRRNQGLRRYARVVAASTLLLIFAGGLVTSTGSGLAVPDWPLSYGQLMPRMIGGILYEHGHRMIAGTVALMTVLLALWTWRVEPRAWVRRLAFAAVGAVLAQALLGGLTVIFLLPPAVSSAHAGLAEIFFGLTLSLATALSFGWLDARPRTTAAGPLPLPLVATLTTAIIYVQVMLGAWMRHTGAGLAIPDFPLAYGRLIPPSFAGGIAIHFAHRVGALAVSLAIVTLVTLVLRRPDSRDDGWLVRPALLLISLLGLQITLGALTIWTAKAVLPTTAHVAVGAATLGTSVVLTLRSWRRFRLPAAAERVAARAAAGTTAAGTSAGARGVTA